MKQSKQSFTIWAIVTVSLPHGWLHSAIFRNEQLLGETANFLQDAKMVSPFYFLLWWALNKVRMFFSYLLSISHIMGNRKKGTSLLSLGSSVFQLAEALRERRPFMTFTFFSASLLLAPGTFRLCSQPAHVEKSPLMTQKKFVNAKIKYLIPRHTEQDGRLFGELNLMTIPYIFQEFNSKPAIVRIVD